jgi:predicted nucleic acid-binding protein
VIVVDSSVWVDFFNGTKNRHTDLLDQLLGRERILIGDIILTEVLQGFRRDADFQRARELLEALEFRDMLGKAMALRCAENYRKLRRAGITVRKTIDVMIATFCIEGGHELLHTDRDFDAMEKRLGLKVVRAR